MSQGLTVPPELDAEMAPAVRAFVKLLLGRIEQLEAEVAELRQRLARAERGFRKTAEPPQPEPSQPEPSQPDQSPAKDHTANIAKTKKKRGGQPGHRKHFRQLIPTADCDDVQVLKPAACRRCGTKLVGHDPDPLRHQVFELPEIKLHATEYQLHRLTWCVLPSPNLCDASGGCSDRAERPAADRLHGVADGTVSAEQTASCFVL